jgi:hypothetical protein
MAQAYRSYVADHPDRYLLQCSAARVPEYVDAGERAGEAVRAVLRSCGLRDDLIEDCHAVFRATVHGMIDLDARNALGTQHHSNQVFDMFVRLFAAGLSGIQE